MPNSEEEELIRKKLRELAKRNPRWGYRKATTKLREEGYLVNKKLIGRLWREEGLRVPRKSRKHRRGRTTDKVGKLRRATLPNEVWAIDFQFDSTIDGKQLKFLNIVDEFTREALAIEVGRSITSYDLVDTLENLVKQRGAPRYVRCDNGPELISKTLKEWCNKENIQINYIEPGSPWENPFVESFNSRFRDEFLNINIFYSVLEAKVFAEDWRNEYNEERPHSSLGMLAPANFAMRWKENQIRQLVGNTR